PNPSRLPASADVRDDQGLAEYQVGVDLTHAAELGTHLLEAAGRDKMAADEIAGCLVAGASLEWPAAIAHRDRADEAASVQTRLDLVAVEPVGRGPEPAHKPGAGRF